MKKTILIVDDFKNTQFVTQFTLKNKGCNTLKALSGKEALLLLEKNDVDHVISDFKMPQINGIELVEQIKKKQKHHKPPILILSTEIKKEVKDKAYKAGASAWIKKPFTIEQLLKIVEKAIS